MEIFNDPTGHMSVKKWLILCVSCLLMLARYALLQQRNN